MSTDNLAEAVCKWLRAGAEINAGLRLFSLASSNRHFSRMVETNPTKYKAMLITKLCALVEIDPKPITDTIKQPARPKFRDDYPFLRDKNCPTELKILAADKISAWESYTSKHNILFDCTTPEECYIAARGLLDDYLENRLIFEELDHYKQYNTPLGKHPIFERMRKIGALKKLSIPSLFHEQARIKYRIWWLRAAIAKNEKPHLKENRQALELEYSAQLLEVEKIIDSYAK